MATATLTLGSQNRWLADGTTTDWNFNFAGGYISTDHVFAYSMSTDTIPVRHDYVVTSGSFVSQYVLRITPAVPNGHTLVVYRDSRNNGLPLADFVDGGGINETDLDAIARQAIFVNQETLDSATTQFQTSQPELFDQFAQATLDQVNATVDPIVSGLAAEVAARTTFQTDISSAAAGNGAAKVGFDWALIPAAVDKVDWGLYTSRTWVNVLRYIPINLWSGIAAGTSTTDVAAYISTAFSTLKATARGGTLFFPPGVYLVSSCALQWNTTGSSVSISFKGSGQKATVFKKFGTSTSPVFDFTVPSLGNGVFASFEDFSVVGISTCNGINMTLFARYQTKNLGISLCNTGLLETGCLIANHYDPHWANNITGYKCVVGSGGVYPNLKQFFGGAVFQNSSWGFDFNDGDSIFVYGTDIELNGTAGVLTTGGVVLRSTLGVSGGNASVAFNGAWFEANNGNGLLIESATGLAVALRDTKHVNNEANNEITCGAIRSLIIDNAQANAFGDTFTIGAVQSLVITGGSVWTLTNSAVSWELHGVTIGGSLVKYRVGGSGLGTYNQNAERHNSATGNVSVPHATATTLYTVAGATPRMLNVFACLGGSGVNYTVNGRFAWDGANLIRMSGDNALNHTLTASGANIQSTQTSGLTQSVFFALDAIGT